jgi:hypothetical protein
MRMAGRPVAARGGGGGLMYGLIAFVVIGVASLGAFVWKLTANQQLQDEWDGFAARVKQYGDPPAYYAEEARARGSTVFATMNGDMEDVAFLVAGRRDAVRPAIVDAANALLETISGDAPERVQPGNTLLTALENLHRGYRDLSDSYAELTRNLKEARDEILLLEEGVKAARDEFQQQVAELEQELMRLSEQQSQQMAAKDEQLARQQAEAEAVSEELSDLKIAQQQREREHEIVLERLRTNLKTLEDQVRELKPGGFEPYDILTKADGRVLRAIPGSDVVYINLGAEDRIRPGMTFEVFEPTGHHRPDLRGKASIEVIAALETTAECRLTRRTPGRPVLEGDVVVNIAYERNRLPKFVVLGEFDLDYDGQKEFDGAEKVAAIIRAWGGRVTDEIDETTDFVVVGTGPQLPMLPGDQPVTDVIRSLADARLEQLQEYRQDLDQARALYIPIITQNQFLFLTGYSGRGPILTD